MQRKERERERESARSSKNDEDEVESEYCLDDVFLNIALCPVPARVSDIDKVINAKKVIEE